VLCEGIPAIITLPVAKHRVTLYPLDESGNRREAAAVHGTHERTAISLDPKHRTLWYEVEIGQP
jgi:hypothetical protein